MRQASLASDIDHSPKADGGIDGETDGRGARARRPQLEDIVDEHLRLVEVDDDVVDRFADDPRRERPVEMDERTDRISSEFFLELELSAVEFLVRIARRRRMTAPRGGPYGESQRHAHGDRHCAHGSLHDVVLNTYADGALRKPTESFGRYEPPRGCCILRFRELFQSSRAVGYSAASRTVAGWSLD